MDEFETASAAWSAVVRSGGHEGGATPADAALEVGASAARLGVPLHEVLDRVERASPGGQASARVVRWVAEGWVEAQEGFAADRSCRDPLTSMDAVPHLRARLDDLYRQAEHRGGDVSHTHRLVVVELVRRPAGHSFEGALRALEVAEVMHVVFPAHETLTQLADRRFAALVATEDADPVGTALLARLLGRTRLAPPEPRIWVEVLPADHRAVGAVLTALTR
ncbi:hypothetical protein [Aeromicrobium marinum]|uniref:hypothetical protein n=1 Tax=Aeromicrobium marinum TaxID=219314 RepID=UPI00068036E9|nr:hypothetical protein [Aeromicrobium marinum]